MQDRMATADDLSAVCNLGCHQARQSGLQISNKACAAGLRHAEQLFVRVERPKF